MRHPEGPLTYLAAAPSQRFTSALDEVARNALSAVGAFFLLRYMLSGGMIGAERQRRFNHFLNRGQLCIMAKASWAAICSAALVVSLSVYVPAARGANLLGASVTGDVHFKNYPSNYYDPLNGFAPVPAGYLNSLPGTYTVTIQDPAIEFGFGDNSNLDTADFTETQLIITDVMQGGSNNWIQTFISPAFRSISKVSDTFNQGGVNYTLVDNTITLTWAGTT
jgi:hypothetical protein